MSTGTSVQVGGSTRKYLLYAIGEIALVVIGILIALQINNWNEKQKLNKTEIYLIIELVNEMKQNKKLLEESLTIHRAHDSISTNILTNWSDLNEYDKISHLRNQRSYWTTDLLSGVMNAIITEHGLSIISDDSLTQFISSWDDKKNDFYENEEQESHLVHDRLYPLMSNYFSLKQVYSYLNGDETEQQRIITESELMDSIESFVQSNMFENLLIQRQFIRRWCIIEIEALTDDLNQAIKRGDRIIHNY